MEESFRRAIRKMTGHSLLRFGTHPNRSRMEATMAQSMAVNWSIALFEHLDAVEKTPEKAMAGPEMISFSAKAFKLADTEFPKLIDECREKFEEFRHKWAQRYTTEEIHRMLLQGNWLEESDLGFALASKNTKSEVNNLYLATVHLMVGDAEKLFVMETAHVQHLQDRLCKFWYEESAIDAVSKILPCLEASFRKREDAIVSQLRSTVSVVAKGYFAGAFSRSKQKHFASSLACVRSIGRAWDLNFAYENAFLAYLDDFCDYVSGLCLLILEWYHEKWSLYLRGFSRGQLDLFENNSV